MRAKELRVEVLKVRDTGQIPPYIPLIHRHFQKACPALANRDYAQVTAPVDLLSLMMPEWMIDHIESIEVTYKKKKA